MKKDVLFFLVFGIISCLVLMLITCGVYKENRTLKKQLIVLKNDIKMQNKQLKNIPETIEKLKEDQENLKILKENMIKQYEKWTRQNQVLEDLLN